jgi:hypothetical protein
VLLDNDPDGAGTNVVYTWETRATSADPWIAVGTNTNTFTPTSALAGQELQLTIDYNDGQNYPTSLAPLVTTIEPDTQVDLLTGTMRAPRRINLEGRGRKTLTLYGSAEIDVREIELDSLIFGGEADDLLAPKPENDDYFGVATRKRGGQISYRASFKDANGDGFVDLIAQVRVADMDSVLDDDDNQLFAYASLGEANALFESNRINFV